MDTAEEENLPGSAAPQNAHAIQQARRRAEEELARKTDELAQSVSLLRATLDSTADGIVVTDREGRVTDFNEKLLRIWNLSPDEMMPEKHRELRASISRKVKDSGQYLARLQHIYESWPEETFDVLELNDGRVVERYSNIQRIERNAGRVWSFRDVTERRHTEEKLRQQQEWFRVTLSSIGDAVITTDTQGNVTFLNPVAEKMTGWRSDEAVGHPLSEVFHIIDDVTKTVLNPVIEVLQEGAAVGLADHTSLISRDGKETAIEDSAAPIRDSAGNISGAVIVFHDVGERRKTEAALREEYVITEQLNDVARALASQLDVTKIVQLITDAGTRITRAQFGAFFYNVPDEASGSYMLYALSGVPRAAFEKFPMPRATGLFGPTFRGEGVIRLDDVRKDPRFGHNAPFHGMPAGHLPVVSYLAVPVISRTGDVLGGLFFGHAEPGIFNERDEKIIVGIAAQTAAAMDTARAYQSEQQARAAAEQANHAKDHFLAALSHELRTPLTPVLALLSNLCDEASSLPKTVAHDLETMRRNVELEARLIDDLLDLTRISRGKLELHPTRIPLGEVIEDAIETCLLELKARKLSLIREIADPKQVIWVDGARITQVLWNLLKNAIKFTPEGGTITIRSHIQPIDDKQHLTIEVEDTGRGIEPELFPRLFNAFEQGDRQITRQFGGLGLGLAISRAIAESHHGTLTAKSAGLDMGSTFTLSLPFKVPDRKELSPSPPLTGEDPALPPMIAKTSEPFRVLLVEDHMDTATSLSTLLKRRGYVVTIARDVTTALKLAETKEFHIVISDLGLPDGTGYEIMKQLREAQSIPGIALSGYGMEEDVRRCLQAGFSEHLAKPVKISQLEEALARLLRHT